eukprot:3566602-Amphidinium_carterae.1
MLRRWLTTRIVRCGELHLNCVQLVQDSIASRTLHLHAEYLFLRNCIVKACLWYVGWQDVVCLYCWKILPKITLIFSSKVRVAYMLAPRAE